MKQVVIERHTQTLVYTALFFSSITPLSYAEQPDYLPDCIVRAILGGIISVEGIEYWEGLSRWSCSTLIDL